MLLLAYLGVANENCRGVSLSKAELVFFIKKNYISRNLGLRGHTLESLPKKGNMVEFIDIEKSWPAHLLRELQIETWKWVVPLIFATIFTPRRQCRTDRFRSNRTHRLSPIIHPFIVWFLYERLVFVASLRSQGFRVEVDLFCGNWSCEKSWFRINFHFR